MRSKLERIWKNLSAQQAAVIVAIVVATGWTISHTDPATWEKLAEYDPTDVGLRIGLVLLAVAGVFTRGRGGGSGEPPAPRGKRSTPAGGATALVVGLGLLAASSTSACSLSTTQRHTAAIHVAASSSRMAGEVISAAVTRDAETSCPDSIDDAADVSCISSLRSPWGPADAAMLSVRVALVGWLEAVAVGETGSGWTMAFAAVRRVMREWSNLVRVLVPFGVVLPELPPIVEEVIALDVPGGRS